MSLFRRSSPEARMISGSGLTSFAVGGPASIGDSLKDSLSLVPLYAATAMLADSISILPYAAYTYTSGGRQKLQPQPQLCWAPHLNPIFTRVEWLHQFATSFLLRGNAYGVITAIDQAGIPSKIQWLNPDGVHVDERKGSPIYWYGDKELDISTLVHIPWYPQPGSVVGLSPVGLFKQTIQTGRYSGKFGRDWFKNGTMPSGHLKYGSGPLDARQAAQVKERFKSSVAGNDVFVSGNDWDWKALSVKPDEAQFLQTMRATANDIAAIFRVDPADIGGEAANGLTYATLELNQIKLQVRALQPIFSRLESHLSRLMPDYQYIKFNPDALIRTDIKTRMEAHEIALRTGMETQDEGRALEDKAPLTAQELADWKANYGKQPAAPNTQNGGTQNAGS